VIPRKQERHIALKIAYDGTNFYGFQRQPRLRTIQGTLEEILESLSGSHLSVQGAGRTDAGVHARGQVVAFPLRDWPIPAERTAPALNGTLPAEMAVLAAAEAPAGFHPRYDALSKTYHYTVFRRAVRCPLWRLYALHQPADLNLRLMREAAADLKGEHDFSAFQNTGRPVKSAVRVLQEVLIEEDDLFLHFWFTANGFLYQMVRVIVGTLLEIGLERLEPAVVPKALETGKRELLGPTAPPHGLCLERVVYPEGIFVE